LAIPNAYLSVNVPHVSGGPHSIGVTCANDISCGWPGCYPTAVEFSSNCDDDDGDLVCNDEDNCPGVANDVQTDSDGDSFGDACDVCPLDPLDDEDADGSCGDEDNCPGVVNDDQANADEDSFGDACDVCPLDPLDDEDGDRVCGDLDVCPGTVLPEGVPTVRLGVNRFANTNGDGVFDTTTPAKKGARRGYTVVKTGGCSCEQIVEELSLGNGLRMFGCTIEVMELWLDVVIP